MDAECTPRLSERFAAARRARFVGRRTELELFRTALVSKHPPFSVLHVFGPGGIGKTTLLMQYARLADDAGATVVRLDGRDLEPTPPGFLVAVQQALGLPAGTEPYRSLRQQRRCVLLIDTYEALLPLDSWLRESFLPELPDATIVVIAGRQAPASTWRTDPEWAELAHILPLRNLPPDDSRAYLRACGISDHQQSPVLDFTHGHPLALALVADLLVRGEPLDFSPDYSPDVVRSLLQRVVEQLPGGAHYHALEVCARTRVTTQELLNHVLGRDEAASAFEWLRGLSFIEHTPDGVVPHDLAREILDADLRWRDPEGYRDLHGRILRYLVGRLQTRTGREQQRAYFDFVYLSRTSPVMRSYYDWETMTAAYAEPANPADYDSILTMVRRHEGRASERVAEFWLRRRPDAFVAFRRAGQQLSDSQQCCCWRRLIRRNARLTRRLPRHGVSPTTVSHCDQVSACSTIVTG